MSMIRSAQVTEPGGPFIVAEREIREPDRGQVRITVEACGVCPSIRHRRVRRLLTSALT
jgi:alcohol dehydrogenase